MVFLKRSWEGTASWPRSASNAGSADVVGYSRLMGADEEATLATLKAHREVIDGLIGDHGGRVFGSAGDSVIA